MVVEPRKTVLVVEDDQGVAVLERRHLERAGYDVIVTATPQEALEQLSQHPVDLILLDYRLPGETDGLAFYDRVKAAGFDMPVILVTGHSTEATVIKALRLGVRDFITKSLEYLDYLPEAVGRVLKQVATEHQLAESEARLASIIRSAKDAIVVTAHDLRITLFNAAAEQMFRCTAAAALGQPLRLFIPPEYSDEPSVSTTQQLRSGTRGLRADGEEFPLEASVSPVHLGSRKFYTVIVRDLTDRKKLEAQYLHAQRMEGIGVLAGGVAHDFNNLLTIINGYGELLLTQLPPQDPSRPYVTEICRAGEKAASLTRQLLAFSRKLILVPQVLDLNLLVSEIHKLLGRLIGEDIRLETALAPELGRVRADPGQIEQVLLNLVVNARDAMPTGGRLTIETKNVELDESYTRSHAEARPGSYVLLAVSDTGSGIEESIQSQIFEPFFTTKEVGKGTGLGLATVYGIVKQSGGNIDFYSERGLGTTFKIYLPSIVAAVPPDAVVERYTAPKGTETVLVAEDEEGVRLLVRLALESHGYKLLEAGDGDAALEVSGRYPDRIDLLVTDVVMPGLGGRQLVDQLTAARPGLKVLYLSGYTDDAVIRHGVLDAGVAFLQKPFTPSVLAKKVREILDSGG